jgi:hypothetical protein
MTIPRLEILSTLPGLSTKEIYRNEFFKSVRLREA